MYDKQKAKDYYQKNKAYILQVHQAWAKKNVDQGGSVWRRYGRRARIKNPNIDKEYYARHREEILHKKKIYYQRKKARLMVRAEKNFLPSIFFNKLKDTVTNHYFPWFF